MNIFNLHGAIRPVSLLILLTLCLAGTMNISGEEESTSGGNWILAYKKGIAVSKDIHFSDDGKSIIVRQEKGKDTVRILIRELIFVLQKQPSLFFSPWDSEKPLFFAELVNGDILRLRNPSFDGKTFTSEHAIWGSFAVEGTHVHRVFRQGLPGTRANNEFTGILLKNGDRTQGKVRSLNFNEIVVEMEGIGEIPVGGLKNVSEVIINSRAESKPVNRSPESARFFLVSGETVSGVMKKNNRDVWSVQTEWRKKTLNIYSSWIQAAAFSGAQGYLSNKEPSSVEKRPYVHTIMDWRKDQSLLGGSLNSGGFSAPRGISLQSGTALTYSLSLPKGKSGLFCAIAGINANATHPGATAALKIHVDNQPSKELVLAPGQFPQPIWIRLAPGAQKLRIEADYADAGSVADIVDLMWTSITHESQ